MRNTLGTKSKLTKQKQQPPASPKGCEANSFRNSQLMSEQAGQTYKKIAAKLFSSEDILSCPLGSVAAQVS